MSKPVLFVDIDGTIADSATWWIELYNQEHGTSYKKSDVKGYSFDDYIPGGLKRYYSNYNKVNFVLGAPQSIAVLSTKYRIVYVTVGFGGMWLKENLSPREDDFIGIADRSLLRGYALIDDSPSNLDVFQGERYLVSQPWNTDRGLNDVTWEEITQHLMEVEHV